MDDWEPDDAYPPAECSVPQAHDANRRHWDAMALDWKRLRDQDGLWRRCHQEPRLAFEGRALETLRECAGDLREKRVCVVGSGDNYAAFALAGLGAQVTSVDISEQQLQIAAARASELGLRIRFVRADAAELHCLADSSFDLVCSTNGFLIWLADLNTVFSEIARVLEVGGCYVFYDLHPFQRPWSDQVAPIEMSKPYWDRRPYDSGADAETCEFHWALADILNALAGARLILRRVIESPAADSRFWQGHSYVPGSDAGLLDWRRNPRAGLPVWLTVAAVKGG
jgi:SAM-dependent methyltransferase